MKVILFAGLKAAPIIKDHLGAAKMDSVYIIAFQTAAAVQFLNMSQVVITYTSSDVMATAFRPVGTITMTDGENGEILNPAVQTKFVRMEVVLILVPCLHLALISVFLAELLDVMMLKAGRFVLIVMEMVV